MGVVISGFNNSYLHLLLKPIPNLEVTLDVGWVEFLEDGLSLASFDPEVARMLEDILVGLLHHNVVNDLGVYSKVTFIDSILLIPSFQSQLHHGGLCTLFIFIYSQLVS